MAGSQTTPRSSTSYCLHCLVLGPDDVTGWPLQVQPVGKTDAALSHTAEQDLGVKARWEGMVLTTGSQGLGRLTVPSVSIARQQSAAM